MARHVRPPRAELPRGPASMGDGRAGTTPQHAADDTRGKQRSSPPGLRHPFRKAAGISSECAPALPLVIQVSVPSSNPGRRNSRRCDGGRSLRLVALFRLKADPRPTAYPSLPNHQHPRPRKSRIGIATEACRDGFPDFRRGSGSKLVISPACRNPARSGVEEAPAEAPLQIEPSVQEIA